MARDRHWDAYWNNWLNMGDSEQEYHLKRVGMKSKTNKNKKRGK